MATRSARKGARTPSSANVVRYNALRALQDQGGDGGPVDPMAYWKATRNKGFESFEGLSSEDEYEEIEEEVEIELPETPANLTVGSTQETVGRSSRRQSVAPAASTGAKRTPAVGSALPTEDEEEEEERYVAPPKDPAKRLSFGGALRESNANRRASRGRPSSDDEEDDQPPPKKSATAAAKAKGKQPTDDEEEDQFEPMQTDEPSAPALDDDFADTGAGADYEDEEDDEKSVSVAARRNTRTSVRGRGSRTAADEGAMDVEDDDDGVVRPKKPASKPTDEPKGRGRGKKAASAAPVEAESEDGATKSRGRGKKAAAPTQAEQDADDEVEQPRGRGKKAATPVAAESDGEEEKGKSRGRGKKAAAATQPDSESEEYAANPRGRGKASDETIEEDPAKRTTKGRPAKGSTGTENDSEPQAKKAKKTAASSKAAADTKSSSEKAAASKAAEEPPKEKRAAKSASSSQPTRADEKATATKMTRASKADVAAPEKPAEKPTKPASGKADKPSAKEEPAEKEPPKTKSDKVDQPRKTDKPSKTAATKFVAEEPAIEDLDNVDLGDAAAAYLDEMDVDIFAHEEESPAPATKKQAAAKSKQAPAEEPARGRKQAEEKDKSERPPKESKKRKRSPPPARDEEVASLAAMLRQEASSLNGDGFDEQVLAAARANTNAKTKAERRKSVYVPQTIASPDQSSSRRSQRRTVPPVQFWRNERIEYDADAEGLPVAKTVIKKVKPPVLDQEGMPVADEDSYSAPPNAKRPKNVSDLIFCDLVNPEMQGEIQTTRTFYRSTSHVLCLIGFYAVAATPGDWIKYGPRSEWFPYAEYEGFEPTAAHAFSLHKDAMSETLVVEIPASTDIHISNEGYFGRRTFSVLSGTVQFVSNETPSSIKSGGVFFVPAMNPFLLRNSGAKPAYLSLSTIFYTI